MAGDYVMDDNKIDRILELLTELRIDMATVKTDLHHHIKRSDNHEIQLQRQEKLIARLWFAVAMLAGTGAGVSGPSLLNWIRSIM